MVAVQASSFNLHGVHPIESIYVIIVKSALSMLSSLIPRISYSNVSGKIIVSPIIFDRDSSIEFFPFVQDEVNMNNKKKYERNLSLCDDN